MVSLDWLVGFIEGEGCFSMCVEENTNTSGSFQVHYGLIVAQKEVEVLHKIKEFLAYNDIQSKIYSKDNQTATLNIRGLLNCIKIGNLLSQVEWHSKKYKDFLRFKEIVDLVQSKRHLSEEGSKRILQLVQENKKNNGQGRKRVKQTDYSVWKGRKK
jgi:hypothetical protein